MAYIKLIRHDQVIVLRIVTYLWHNISVYQSRCQAHYETTAACAFSIYLNHISYHGLVTSHWDKLHVE